MKPVIGITMGDPAGIGPEITVKALCDSRLYEAAIPVVIGDTLPLQDAIDQLHAPLVIRRIDSPCDAAGTPGTLNLIDMGLLAKGSWAYGQVSATAGNAAFQYVVRAIELAREQRIQAVVTGPINKEAINLAGHHFSGHTEIFAHYLNTKQYAMMLTTPSLRVVHVTTHVSMRNACDRITEERVYTVIRLADEALRDLGIRNPRIAVAGFNAHCSENGLFGSEEASAITPAISHAKAEGLNVEGPIPPDTVFVKALADEYDVVVAMYHDQGHIPLKLVGFHMDPVTKQFSSMQGVNLTIGLPVIRTSVDHGTAFDRAGRGVANENSMIDAYLTAVQMAAHQAMRKEESKHE